MGVVSSLHSRSVVWDTLSSTLWEAIPLLTAIATFAAYVLSGHELKSSTAFTAIALFISPSPPDT